MLYILLIGRYPFHNQSMRNMFAKITRGKFQIPPCSGVSLDARILLRSLIRVEPDERMFASEILSHNWFKQNIEDDHLMTNNSMNTTDKYSNLTSVTMAVNYLNNLNSNRNITVLNNSNMYQRKPLESALSVPLRSQYNS